MKRQMPLDRGGGFDQAIAEHHLADVQREQGKLSDAIASAKRALALTERSRGPDEDDTGRMTLALADLLVEAGEPGTAAPLLRRAHAILRRTRGAMEPEVKALAERLRVLGF